MSDRLFAQSQLNRFQSPVVVGVGCSQQTKYHVKMPFRAVEFAVAHHHRNTCPVNSPEAFS